MSPDIIIKSMIIKHFNQHKQKLCNKWENVNYKYSALDPNKVVEQSEKQIADSAKILDDNKDKGIRGELALTH